MERYSKYISRNNIASQKDKKFYKKRIQSLFKDILKGSEEEYTKELKEIHSIFVNTAIKYFERVDTKDIIQCQYADTTSPKSPDDILNDIGGNDLFTIDEANDIMMRKTIIVPNLDNYVIFPNQDLSSNICGHNLRVIPLKMDIDLKTPDLKTKGVKPKIKKSKL